jgi:GNAT superfamily N-acetyltransferase
MNSEAAIDLHTRPATAADRPRLVPLINSAFSIETFLGGTRTDDDRLAAMMEKGVVFVLENGAGCLLASVYAELRGPHGYLGMLAVDPAYQGSGLGRRIVQAAEDHFRRNGCQAIDITVLNMRPELLPIYRRFGFVEIGAEPFHPGRPIQSGVECHCIVMSKPLIPLAQ